MNKQIGSHGLAVSKMEMHPNSWKILRSYPAVTSSFSHPCHQFLPFAASLLAWYQCQSATFVFSSSNCAAVVCFYQETNYQIHLWNFQLPVWKEHQLTGKEWFKNKNKSSNFMSPLLNTFVFFNLSSYTTPNSRNISLHPLVPFGKDHHHPPIRNWETSSLRSSWSQLQGLWFLTCDQLLMHGVALRGDLPEPKVETWGTNRARRFPPRFWNLESPWF